MVCQSLKTWASTLKKYVYALYLASRCSDVPSIVKLLAVMVVAYALSPIDLIPDFIPVIGYLDDLILLPLAIWGIIKLIPKPVWQQCLTQAEQPKALPHSKVAAAVIMLLWMLIMLAAILWLINLP